MFDKTYLVDATTSTTINYDDTKLRETMTQIHKEKMENSRRVDISIKEYEELVAKSEMYDRLIAALPAELGYELNENYLTIKNFHSYQILDRGCIDPLNSDNHILSLNYILTQDIGSKFDKIMRRV